MKVKYVNYGLANNFGDYIEINKCFLKNKELHEYVLEHEKGHTDKLFSIQDLKNDVFFDIRKVIKLIKFIIFKPSTWIDFMPIQIKKNRGIYFDLNMIILYIILITLIISIKIYF